MNWDVRGLRKSTSDVRIGGVCGGLGEHTPFPAWAWRAGFLGLFLVVGCGAVAYGVLWLTIPDAESSTPV